MIFIHIKFQIPSSTGSLATAIKTKAKENDSSAAMLFFIL